MGIGSVGSYGNGSLRNLNGLSRLNFIGGGLSIRNNDSLLSLQGLLQLDSIGGGLYIWGNESMTSLSGIENLIFIGGGLQIGDDWELHGGNPSLTSLSGLKNLEFINGFLKIEDNTLLTSLVDLENVKAGSISDIYITENSNLFECAIHSICDYLASPNGEIDIQNNAPGCNDQQEVEDACEVISSEGLVAWYPFNGNANDESENDNHGTVYGATLSTDRFGNADSAYTFDGSTNHISIPVDINFNAKPQLTIVAWVKPSDVNPVRTIISHDNVQFDRSITIDNRGGGIGYSCFMGTGVLGYFPANVDQWVQLAVIYNQLTNTAKFYQNTSSISGATSFGTGWTYTWIGGNPSFGEYFSGTIDDIRIYDRLLNEFEIQALYHEGDWKIKPTFLMELNDQAACKNDSIAFEAKAEGIPSIHYQWQKDDIDIPGDTNSVFIIPNVQSEDEGEYRCIATNDYGADTSKSASLSIEFEIPTVILGHPSVSENQIVLYSISLEEGHNYEFIVEGGNIIDESENTISVHWSAAGQGFIHLIEQSELGCYADTNTLNVTIGSLGFEEHEAINLSISPNPFTSSTTLKFELTQPGKVDIKIYNQMGELVEVIQTNAQSGKKTFTWNASRLPSGIYFIRLQSDNGISAQKVVKL